MVLQPLNLFQRLLRTWEQVHPYNAAQIARLTLAPAPAQIQYAWHDALAALGLGKLRTHADSFGYVNLNGQAERYPVRFLPNTTCLDDHLTVEMNRPFDDPDEPPFRPFVLARGDGIQVGIVYRHWVADSVSIRLLMREWIDRMMEPRQGILPRPRLAADGYWKSYALGNGRLAIDQSVLGLFRDYMRLRTVRKVCLTGVADYPVRVVTRTLPDGLAATLRSVARARQVTVGDLLLAALVQACWKYVPLQQRTSRRDIAVGNIVDLRRSARGNLSEAFGLHLGFSHVVCRRGIVGDFDRVLASVHAQNRVRRRDGVAHASIGWMTAALIAHRFSKPEKLYRIYRKEIPLAGGLSNVNLADAWTQSLHPHILHGYLRISPTGPMAPLALGVTSLRQTMTMSLTYRPALLDADAARGVLDSIVASLSLDDRLPFAPDSAR